MIPIDKKHIKSCYFDIFNAKALDDTCKKEMPFILEGQKPDQSLCKERIELYYEGIARQYDKTGRKTAGIKNYLNQFTA